MTKTKQAKHFQRPGLSDQQLAVVNRAVAQVLRKHGLPVDKGAVGGMVWYHEQLRDEQRARKAGIIPEQYVQLLDGHAARRLMPPRVGAWVMDDRLREFRKYDGGTAEVASFESPCGQELLRRYRRKE
jgi:hypothetical protein